MDELYKYGCDLLEQNKLTEAFEAFVSILQQDNQNYLAMNKLGVICARERRPEDARAHFQAALAINPDNAPTIVNLGNLSLEQGEYQEAIAYYEKALSIDSKYHLAYYNLGVAYKKIGNYDEYFKNLKEYKRYYKEYLKSEDKKEAFKLRNKALQISGILVILVALFFILK